MPNIGLLGDPVPPAKVISTAFSFVRVNGIPVATVSPADLVLPHLLGVHQTPPPFLATPVQTYTHINGLNVSVTGVLATCSDALIGTAFATIL